MQDLNFLCQLLSELSAYNNGRKHAPLSGFFLQELLRSVAVSFAISLERTLLSAFVPVSILLSKDMQEIRSKLREVLLNLLKKRPGISG